ncbi:MAG: MSCRAMM family adhesin SdrC [Alkalibacterium thalassium]|nr:MSCRAMM family adhesin SdrC [Alkalibacterium thalassium]
MIEGNHILTHYQKVIGFRNEFSELLSRGTRETFLTSEDEDWMIVERALEDESVFLAFNTSEEEQLISVGVDSSDVIVMDHYSDSQYSAEETGDSQIITFTLPAMADGGTALLTVDNGSLIAEEIETPDDSEEPVEETEDDEEATDPGNGEQPDGESGPGTDQESDGDDPVSGGEEIADSERDAEGDGQSADHTDSSENPGAGQDSEDSTADAIKVIQMVH